MRKLHAEIVPLASKTDATVEILLNALVPRPYFGMFPMRNDIPKRFLVE